jgi:acetoin utilization protein AcuB
MLVSELMTTRLVTIELDDKLSVAKEIFKNVSIHHILVIEEGKVFGVVSDRDLYKALSPNIGTMTETYKDASTLNKRIHQIVSRNPIVLKPHSTVDDAIEVFNTYSISCIPIVDHEMKALGIITVRSILKAIGECRLILI